MMLPIKAIFVTAFLHLRQWAGPLRERWNLIGRIEKIEAEMQYLRQDRRNLELLLVQQAAARRHYEKQLDEYRYILSNTTRRYLDLPI